MHDHKKSDRKPLTEEQRAAFVASEREKGALYTHQQELYKAHVHTREALKENAELLARVPEAYGFYNYRREILQALWAAGEEGDTATDDSGDEARSQAVLADLVQELRLNTSIIEKDFKIYAAFVHRHWIYEELGRCAAQEAAGAGGYRKALCSALTKEATQCDALLRLDERNFHAWNHRRWSMGKLREAEALLRPAVDDDEQRNQPPTDGAAASSSSSSLPLAARYGVLFSAAGRAEMAFTTAKISSNFSNYSAWHQRAITVQAALRNTAVGAHLYGGNASGAPPAAAAAAAAAAAPSSSSSSSSVDAVCDGLRALLAEDRHFLTQAVYCDPNDQSAWFYVPFLLQLHRACRATYPAQFTPTVAATAGDGDAAGDDSGGNVEAAFVSAVFALTAEEEKLGEAECYLPHYFMLSYLAACVQRVRRGPEAQTASPYQQQQRACDWEALAHAVRCAVQHKMLPDDQTSLQAGQQQQQQSGTLAVSGDGAAQDYLLARVARLACVLREHLRVADPMRAGLYDDLCKSIS